MGSRLLVLVLDLGNLMSAMPIDWLPANSDRPAFAADLTKALRSGKRAETSSIPTDL
jgi:hypothetical protein